MVPLAGNICTNLITNGTIGKEIGANCKNGNAIGTNGTNVTNQWYHWENPEHTHSKPVTGVQWIYVFLLLLQNIQQLNNIFTELPPIVNKSLNVLSRIIPLFPNISVQQSNCQLVGAVDPMTSRKHAHVIY